MHISSVIAPELNNGDGIAAVSYARRSAFHKKVNVGLTWILHKSADSCFDCSMIEDECPLAGLPLPQGLPLLHFPQFRSILNIIEYLPSFAKKSILLVLSQ